MTSSRAYYNENDKFSAAWLRELIRKGVIADGVVDERSVAEVRHRDLDGFSQCHFFAGIGGWSYALRLSGWPDDCPVWTGSCPCQPFSAAGQRKGFDDPRHLWPIWFRLIRESRPITIFGEQVDKALGWFDLVSRELEGEGYAVGSAIVGAASVGAPHIRQRLWFVADTTQRRGWRKGGTQRPIRRGTPNSGLGQSTEGRRGSRRASEAVSGEESCGEIERSGVVESVRMACSNGGNPGTEGLQRSGEHGFGKEDGSTSRMEHYASEQERITGFARQSRESYWSDCDWLLCIDGKSRPVEPSTFPLAYGLPARVGRLRGYGNAIVPQVAQAFIASYMEIA